MSQAAFAEKIGWTKARVNVLIRGKRGVTAEAALDLAEILGTSPKIWMNFQATYDLDRAKRGVASDGRFVDGRGLARASRPVLITLKTALLGSVTLRRLHSSEHCHILPTCTTTFPLARPVSR